MRLSLRTLLLKVRNHLLPGNQVRLGKGVLTGEVPNLKNTILCADAGNHLELGLGVRLRDCRIDIHGKGNRVVLKQGLRFSGHIDISGEGCLVELGAHTEARGTFILVRGTKQIRVGARCLFAPGTELRTTDSHKIFDASGMQLNTDADICIGDQVWLAAEVLVLKGSEIGSGSVIGVRSLVAGSIPERCVAVGAPARVVKRDISWQE